MDYQKHFLQVVLNLFSLIFSNQFNSSC